MASSSGYGPSTSGAGRRRSEREQYWDFISVPVTETRASNEALEELLDAVLIPDFAYAKNAASKLKRKGMFPDEAMEVEARKNPKRKRPGPLHIAALKRSKKICKMLVEDYKCNPNATTVDDATTLHFAIQGGSQAIIEYLIKCGADPNTADNRGITPLHHAARQGYCEIAGYLLSKGANVDPICLEGEAPLHVAALYGDAKMVKLLSDHNANLNILSRYLHTPLVYSLFGSSLECLQTFIQEGANINTDSPVTPLSVAARKGLAECTNCLLNNSADPNELNEDGKLPLEIAASKGWKECFEILFRVTNPLQKYANLSKDEIVKQEMTVRFFEEHMAIGEGDFAFWEKEYTHALECYSLALKLGHEDISLYAKRSLCHLHNRDELRYLDEALFYADSMNPAPASELPCSEEDAKKLVLEYFKEWKAHNLAEEASREEHP